MGPPVTTLIMMGGDENSSHHEAVQPRRKAQGITFVLGESPPARAWLLLIGIGESVLSFWHTQ
jgi:hypothetical protein